MKRNVHLTRDYPHARSLVWRALTDRALLAEWLMPNDFAPSVGHQFTMQTDPAPGFDGVVHCEVLELVEGTRMRWRWRGGPVDTVVTFELQDQVVFASMGTRLRLSHEGFDGLPAVLVSLILQSGWRGIASRRLPAVLQRLDGNTTPTPDAAHRKRGAWRWMSKLFGPVLRRSERRHDAR